LGLITDYRSKIETGNLIRNKYFDLSFLNLLTFLNFTQMILSAISENDAIQKCSDYLKDNYTFNKAPFTPHKWASESIFSNSTTIVYQSLHIKFNKLFSFIPVWLYVFVFIDFVTQLNK